MNLKSLLRMMFLHYFIIYALTMIATLVFCLFTSKDATFGVDYFWQSMLFALAADLPLLVYYSKKELSNKQYWIRTLLHAALLEALLMPSGYLIGMWAGIGGAAAFFFCIIAVDAAVRGITYLNAKFVADRLNEALKTRRNQNGSGSGADRADH